MILCFWQRLSSPGSWEFSFWAERLGSSLLPESLHPWRRQRGPKAVGGGDEVRTHFVEAVDWMPPLEVRVQYLPV